MIGLQSARAQTDPGREARLTLYETSVGITPSVSRIDPQHPDGSRELKFIEVPPDTISVFVKTRRPLEH